MAHYRVLEDDDEIAASTPLNQNANSDVRNLDLAIGRERAIVELLPKTMRMK